MTHSRSDELFRHDLHQIRSETDRLMAWLMVVQWLAGIVVAVLISPLTWNGADSALHVHVPAAVILGGLLAVAPMTLVLTVPGGIATRHVNAVAQVLFSGLFIHLSGGRIETHFHVFGSLAILAFYRDWKVILTATVVVGVDHLLRGVFWPESVFGVLASSPWRTLEHVFWVAFEDAFLVYGISISNQQMRLAAERQAALEQAHDDRRTVLAQLESQTRALDQVSIVAETDRRGRITYANDRFCEISGFPREELIGQDHRLLNSGHHPHSFFKEMYQAIHRGEVWRGEIRNRRKDGSYYWVDTAIVPFMNDDGTPERFLAIRTDITSQTEAVEDLKNAMERLDLATHAGGIGIWDYDVVTGRLIWDDSMHILHGTNPVEFRGTIESWEQQVHPDDRDKVRELLQAAVHREGEFNSEFRIIRPDGDVRHIRARAAVKRDCSQCAVRMIGVSLDITELLRARERAEEASRAKSDFLASMSHELRTPLNGVLGMVELLAKTQIDDRQNNLLAACQQSGETLLQLINDILDLSKIEADKLELDVHAFELKPLILDTVRMMSWHVEKKELAATCQIDTDADLVVNGDGCRIRQILINLISNAVKFTEQGEITVRVSADRLLENRANVRVSVTDTGIGIPQERRNRLFQTFSQVDSSTTRKYGGTGLGLAICSSLVDLMQGTIGVESEEGVGSEFWFEIPLEISEQQDRDDLHRDDALPGRRALIIGKDDGERERIAAQVHAWQMECITASGIDDALDAIDVADADGLPFDVVLAAADLNDDRDLDLFQWLSSRDDLPVVLTGVTDQSSDDDIAALDVAATVDNSATQHDLYGVVCRLLGETGSVSEVETSDAASVADEETGEPLTAGAHILLAEDNEINSLYMSVLLESLGCSCDVAGNGRLAVQAVQKQVYDLVLMDCQMPEMDGFEATRAIRELQADGLVQPHLPIVALTANAISGDRERCLEAGMDEYLAKPATGEQIAEVVSRFRSKQQPEVAHQEASTEEAAPPPHASHDESDSRRQRSHEAGFNAEALLERCLGQVDLADTLLNEFESTGLDRVREIAGAADTNDVSTLKEAAHSLKGAAGILCATNLQELAAEIEQAARETRIDDILTTVDELTEEMAHCLDSLPSLRSQLHA
ncbi:MAG: hybrid sensor histidine kinase/response regulator [Planctomycetota bacterium]|jgi:PAS domain S-box-containing protein